MDHITDLKISYDRITDLKISYAHINEQIRLLFELIDERTTSFQASVYSLPDASNEDIGKVPDIIPVTAQEGPMAMDAFLQHTLRHHLDKTRSGRILPRLPGVIMIEHPDARECLERLQAINLSKDAFKKMMVELPGTKTQRFELVSKVLPDMVKLQVFRHMLFVDTPLKSVGFSWVKRNSMEHMNKVKVLEKLSITDEYMKDKQALSAFNDMLQQEIHHIDGYPSSATFVIRRPLRVAPMMNLNYYSPKSCVLTDHNDAKNMVAHSPLIVFNHIPKLHPLKTFVRAEQEQALNLDALPLVIERLHLYKYTE